MTAIAIQPKKRKKKLPIGQIVLVAVIFVFVLTCVLPFLNVIAISFSSKSAILRGAVSFIPVEFETKAYEILFSDQTMINCLFYTVKLTVIYTAIAMVMTILMAYPLTKERLVGRKFFNLMALFIQIPGGTELGKLYSKSVVSCQLSRLFIRQEGVENQHIQTVCLQHVDYKLADHARAEQTDLGVVVAAEGIAKASVFPLFTGGVAEALEVTFICQNDLCNGEFGNGNCIGTPCAEHIDAAVEKFTDKALNRACAVEYSLQRGEIFLNLLLCESGHTPCGEDVVYLSKILCAGDQIFFFGKDHFIEKITFRIELLADIVRIDRSIGIGRFGI